MTVRVPRVATPPSRPKHRRRTHFLLLIILGCQAVAKVDLLAAAEDPICQPPRLADIQIQSYSPLPPCAQTSQGTQPEVSS